MNAIIMIGIVSLPIPFVGRTAIGWIVDVTTVCATIAYAYTSIVAFKLAKEDDDKLVKVTGPVGFIISIAFTLYFLIPNLWSAGILAPESYMILILWSIFGFVVFRYVFWRDRQKRVGKSPVVWIVLLFLVYFLTMLWFRESAYKKSAVVLEDLKEYHEQNLSDHGIEMDIVEKDDSDYYLQKKMQELSDYNENKSYIQMLIVLAALAIIFSIFISMNKRQREAEAETIQAEERNRAKSVFLSNMSHDIRTPMNAIIGYTEIAKKDPDISDKQAEYLDKIEGSGKQLLALINDILDMSRIESGKMELEMTKGDIVKTVDGLYDLFITQMETKGIDYKVDADGVANKMVMCDTARLNRVLLNLVSNAYKFTPEGGCVTVRLTENGVKDGFGHYRLSVSDTGMGMSSDFVDKVFDAYERDHTVTGIQGTGLGMAITKGPSCQIFIIKDLPESYSSQILLCPAWAGVLPPPP